MSEKIGTYKHSCSSRASDTLHTKRGRGGGGREGGSKGEERERGGATYRL